MKIFRIIFDVVIAVVRFTKLSTVAQNVAIRCKFLILGCKITSNKKIPLEFTGELRSLC